MNCIEYLSIDEFVPDYFDDPDFNFPEENLAFDLNEKPTHDCDVCGMKVTEFELVINKGMCPGCDTIFPATETSTDDIPF